MGSRAVVRALLVAGIAGCLATPVLLLLAGVRDVGDLADGVVLVPAFLLAGALAARSRPDRPGPVLLLATGTLLAVSHALATLPSVAGDGDGAWWVVNLGSRVAETTAFVLWGALYALLPDGGFRSPGQRRAVVGAVAAAVVVPLAGFFSASPQPLVYVTEEPRTPVPVVVPFLAPLDAVAGFFWLAPVVGLVWLGVRARRMGAEDRARCRWVLWSAVAVALALLSSPLLVRLAGESVQAVVFVLLTATLPVALAAAMLRHRLFDVDVVLRRSLVYGLLALVVLAAWAGIAALAGTAGGRRFSVPVAVVVTLAAAIGFDPARRRLERLADRWFLGERMGRYELVRGLGTSLERTRDPAELAERIADTVRRGLDATWAEVASGPPDREPALSVPLDDGAIRLGPRRDGSGYDDADRELLTVLARQASLALRDARLSADLAERVRELEASRGRIVQAEEAERRRIERDLHDGIQQELVALMAKVEVARAALDRSPEKTARALEELRGLVRQTHADLRTLVAGIHPAVLGDRGLVEAVSTRARQLPVEVAVDGRIGATRFDPDIEGAAYFLVAEALTNVVRHARARSATVVLDRRDGELRLEITDDGVGFPVETASGSGLRGLRDRLEALGGALEVSSRPGRGTRVVGRLPARELVGG